MTNHANGRIPLGQLVHLGGDHYLPPGTAARWRWLQRLCWEKYGIWLVITAGWNGYRPFDIQVIYRRDLGIMAALPGFSTHGGIVNGRVVFAIDVANWALLGWARFAALCRLAGFTVDFVKPQELWHIGDFNDGWVIPAGAATIPPVNPQTTRRTIQEDDMRQIQIGATIYSIAPGYIKAETEGAAASITRAVIGQPDPVDANAQPGGVNKPDAICQSYGIPWEKVEMVREGRGYDLDGNLGKGRIWSLQHDILAALRKGGVPGGGGTGATASEVADELSKRLAR
ncbi:hypothetical protein ABY45_14460 [Microbacterium maritypicum]|uniref:hypothetical protein n=1 Tax=Microbacterium maritypicum TaxID=33918 RepID=UPI003D6E5A8D